MLQNVKLKYIYLLAILYSASSLGGRIIWDSDIQSENAKLTKFYDCDTPIGCHSTSGYIEVDNNFKDIGTMRNLIEGTYKNSLDDFSINGIDDKIYITILPLQDTGCDSPFFLNSLFHTIQFGRDSQDTKFLEAEGSSAEILDSNTVKNYSNAIVDQNINTNTHNIAILKSDKAVNDKTIDNISRWSNSYHRIDNNTIYVYREKKTSSEIPFTALVAGVFGYIVDGGRNNIRFGSSNEYLSKSYCRSIGFSMEDNYDVVKEQTSGEYDREISNFLNWPTP